MTEKPHKGRIKNWRFCQMGPNELPYISGDFLDHPDIRGPDIYTSRIVKFDGETKEIETKNSRYTLVSEGEPSGMPGFPKKGDKMRFVGIGGYPHQLAAARKVFTVDHVYEVDSCHVGAWDHAVTFVGICGHWNGVMFDPIPEGETDGTHNPAAEAAAQTDPGSERPV